MVNADKPQRWKTDIAESVDLYNTWFIRFAPVTYRTARANETERVNLALQLTNNLSTITPAVIVANPFILPILRMVTAPPIARDRLIGLSGATPNLVEVLEDKQTLPLRMQAGDVQIGLEHICETITKLIDVDLFPWLSLHTTPSESDVSRSATVIADRVSGMLANPIIRNAQEKRQLEVLRTWLEARGYVYGRPRIIGDIRSLASGSFCFRLNVQAHRSDGSEVNIPVDAVVMPQVATPGSLPVLIEAKSAGDFTNTNKRRKEETVKADQLRRRYGVVHFVLFLCGYFGADYLGYEAAEGIDWVWEHRPDDLEGFL